MQPNLPDTAIRLDQTSEQLRLVLPLLSKHAADFGPESYALWFSYIAGNQPELAADLVDVITAGARLTAQQTAHLFERHVRDAEASSVAKVSAALTALLLQVAGSTSEVQAASSRSQQLFDTLPTILQGAAATPPSDVSGAHEAVQPASLSIARELAEQSRLMAASLLTFVQQLNRAQLQVDALRTELQQVRQEARVDALTGLQNRRAFDEALLMRIDDAREAGVPLTLIMIDVDHFKRFNDTLGHVMGDKALGAVAKTVQQNLKGKDFVARFGGEEFVVLLGDTPLPAARQVAENLRQAIARIRIRKSATGEVVGGITVSCGLALLHPDDAPVDLLDRADVALYLAKAAGRNQVMVSERAAPARQPG